MNSLYSQSKSRDVRAAKVAAYFVLSSCESADCWGAGERQVNGSPCLEGAEDVHSARRTKMNSVKERLATGRFKQDVILKKKIKVLRESLERKNGGKTESEPADFSRDSTSPERARPKTVNDLPFIYFVVAVDQMPLLAEDLSFQDSKSSKFSQMARARRFLQSRRQRIRKAKNDAERIRSMNMDMGLRLAPLRPSTQPRGFPFHHLNTPASTTTPSRKPDTTKAYGEAASLHFVDALDSQRGRRAPATAWVPRDRVQMPQMSTYMLELPTITPEQKRKALGTSPSQAASLSCQSNSNRKVHFAESLLLIRGSGLGIPPNAKAETDRSGEASFIKVVIPRENSMDPNKQIAMMQKLVDTAVLKAAAEEQHVPGDLELERARTLATMQTPREKSRQGRFGTPMPLPRIDITSTIYNELILKTLQSYMMAEGFSPERCAEWEQRLLKRLSLTNPAMAKNQQAWKPGKTIQDMGPKYGENGRVKSEKGVPDDLEKEHSTVGEDDRASASTAMSIDGKTMAIASRSKSQVPISTFKMSAPGLQQEKTDISIRTDRVEEDST